MLCGDPAVCTATAACLQPHVVICLVVVEALCADCMLSVVSEALCADCVLCAGQQLVLQRPLQSQPSNCNAPA